MYVGWYPMSTVPSPSSRAEWVEINIDLSIIDTFDVSVLAGGVG